MSNEYQGWEENPNILPANSLVISKLHLKKTWFPLHPLYHYLFSIYNIHILQVHPNGFRIITGFICLSLIIDLKLTIENPPKKKLKPAKSANPPPGNLLTSNILSIEWISFAYPLDLPDTSREGYLIIIDPVSLSKAPENHADGSLVTFCLTFFSFPPLTLRISHILFSLCSYQKEKSQIPPSGD